MHASSFIALLAASAVTATPLMARNTPPSYAPAPTGDVPYHGEQPKPEEPKHEEPKYDDKPKDEWSSAPSPSGSSGKPAETGILGNPDAEPNPEVPEGTVAELLTADNAVARFTSLKEDFDAGTLSLVFDHNPAANPGVTPGQGGQVDLAQRGNFPVLTGLGIASATIFFQPCGLNTPHIHPRATEYFTLATKGNMTTGFVLENGLTDEFTAELGIWQGTVFPQGSIHWQQNEECEPAIGVAGLNSDDPGASSIAQNFLRFTQADVVDAALGMPPEISAQNFRDNQDLLPASLAQGVESCLKRCNIKY